MLRLGDGGTSSLLHPTRMRSRKPLPSSSACSNSACAASSPAWNHCATDAAAIPASPAGCASSRRPCAADDANCWPATCGPDASTSPAAGAGRWKRKAYRPLPAQAVDGERHGRRSDDRPALDPSQQARSLRRSAHRRLGRFPSLGGVPAALAGLCATPQLQDDCSRYASPPRRAVRAHRRLVRRAHPCRRAGS